MTELESKYKLIKKKLKREKEVTEELNKEIASLKEKVTFKTEVPVPDRTPELEAQIAALNESTKKLETQCE